MFWVVCFWFLFFPPSSFLFLLFETRYNGANKARTGYPQGASFVFAFVIAVANFRKQERRFFSKNKENQENLLKPILLKNPKNLEKLKNLKKLKNLIVR
jgi:hypothetical protein